MTAHQPTMSRPAGALPARPLPPETLAMVEDMLAQALHCLREAAAPPRDAPDAGALEYDSWLAVLRR
jgi:hypothetical protein